MKTLTPQEHQAISEAKQLLKQYGYFTDNLWHIDDVYEKFDCNEDAAQDILKNALTNEATFDQIWFAIDNAISSHQNPQL